MPFVALLTRGFMSTQSGYVTNLQASKAQALDFEVFDFFMRWKNRETITNI
jgi:hypothetical protein